MYYSQIKYFMVLLAAMLLYGCSSGSNSVQATVDATPVAGAPFSQTVATPINTPITITLKSTKIVSFRVQSQPAHGVLTGEMSGASPVMVYSPNVDYVGLDSIAIDVVDIDGYTAVGTVDIQVLDTVLPTTDTDGDGLVDLEEINVTHTNPDLVDTDGDGFSDFEEVVSFSFNSSINNYRFNPLIADTPEIDIKMVSAPDIAINYTQGTSTVKTIGTSRSATSSQSVSNSTSQTESTAVSEMFSQGSEISTTLEVGVEVGLEPKVTASKSKTATQSYNYEKTTTHEQSTTWSQEQTRENSITAEQNESFAKENSQLASEGEISVSVTVRNVGHISYTLNNLFLSASYWLPRVSNPLVPVGNLAFDSTGGSFPAVTLSPGQGTGVLNFKATGVNLKKIQGILRDSRGLTVRPTLYDMLDQNGQSYNFSSTGITSNDAMIMIDYNANAGHANLQKMVAVNGVRGQNVSIMDVLNKIMRVNATVTTDAYANTYVNSINGVANNAARFGSWVIIHGKQTGNNKLVTTVYVTPEDKARWEARNPNVSNLMTNYDLTQVTLGGGDIVHAVYLQDEDQDGLSNRMEYFYRTDPKNADTDGDLLADGVEAKDGWDVVFVDRFGADIYTHVYSDPTIADTDGDSVDDYSEANFAGLNASYRRDPNRFDTDGDGLDDAIDDRTYLNPGFGNFLANEYDDLSVGGLVSQVDFATNVVNASGQNTYDVYTQFNLPSILNNPLPQGLVNYQVITLRYKDASGQGEFPKLVAPLQDGRPYIKGDLVPCVVPASWPVGSTCNWEVVDVTAVNPAPGAYAFTETTPNKIRAELKTGNVVTIPADVYKYIQFVSVNGHYTRQLVEKRVSPNTDIIEVHMLKADFTNVRTMWSPPTQPLTVTKMFGWVNGGQQTSYVWQRNIDSANDEYQAYDLATGTPIVPYAYKMPNMDGDGQLDVSWELFVGATVLNHRAPWNYTIHSSYQGDYQAGLAQIYDAYTYTWNRQPAYLPNSTTPSMKMFYYDYDPATNVDVAVPVDPVSKGAVYKITVPAVAACYTVRLKFTEYDIVQRHFGLVANPLSSTTDYVNQDFLELCRDQSGIWSASKQTTLGRSSVGFFINGANVTTKGNSYPIYYHSDKMSWLDAKVTPSFKDADLEVEYKIYIK